MTDVKTWSETAAENNQVVPDGFPELMSRSGVNNAAREAMRAIRKWYAAAEWVNVYSTVGDAWTASDDSATTIKLAPADGQTAEDISGRFPAGSRAKFTGGVSAQYGFVVSAVLSTDDTIVTITVDDGSALDAATNSIEIGVVRDMMEKTAYYPTGTTLAQTPPQVPTIDDLGDGATFDMGAGNNFNADLLDNQHASQIIAAAASGGARNPVFNGEFMVWQRGTPIDADTTDGRTHVNDNGNYCADRWKLLSGNAATPSNDLVDCSRDTTAPPTGFWSNLKLTAQGTPSAQDFAGVFQILEGKDSAQFAGSSAVSLAVSLKSGGDIGFARFMLLGWTGTEDTFAGSEDPISDWETAGLAAGPTFKANWTKLIDSTQITTSGTWARTEMENQDISATGGVKNIAILIYIDDASWVAGGGTLEITGVQLENSAASSAYGHRDYYTELTRCQRYFNHTFDEDVDPRNNVGEHTGLQWSSGNAQSGSDDGPAMTYHYPTTMRADPTVVVYNPATTTAASFYDNTGATDILQATLSETITEKRVHWTFTGTTYDNIVIRGHVEADADF